MNQLGFVQAIGGVNEKIEGFFDVCKQSGLTGEQGVIIPEANIDNLMLRDDVVAAAKEKKFNIYSYATIDEAILLLTGVEPGMADDEGNYPIDTVNFLVREKLTQFAQQRAEFAKPIFPKPELLNPVPPKPELPKQDKED